MNVTRWFILIVLIMYKSWITRGFLFDKSTIGPQLSGGSVLTNQQFLSLIELIADEKQHRYKLEQKVAELEKHQASVDQDSKISQMENYIKQLESRISSVEQITALPVNKTCICLFDSQAITNLSKRIIVIELKYNALETKCNNFDHARNKTDQRLTELSQEVIDLRNLKTVNQVQTLNSLKNELQTVKAKTNLLESRSQARSQDFLALYRSTQITANYVTNNTLSISQIHNYMNMSELVSKEKLDTTEAALKNLEDRQNQTDDSLSQFYDTCNKTDQRFNQLQQEIVDLRNLRNENQLQTLNSIQKEVKNLEDRQNQTDDSLSQFYDTCNKTNQRFNQLQQEIVDLRNLRNENQLQTLNFLQKEVQTLNFKSHQLESISQARSQDFLALYRKTQTTENYVTNITFIISQIRNNMNQSENIAKERYSTTENSLKKLEDGQNHTNKYLRQLEHRHNVTYSELYSKIHNESEKVMVTACTNSDVNYNSRQNIKYNIIRANTGISNTAGLLSSGVFICEKPGLYIIMVLMRGISPYSFYDIKKNNINMLFIQNMYSKDVADRSVSGSFAIELDIGDTIYVMPGTDVKINAESCLSVVKVK